MTTDELFELRRLLGEALGDESVAGVMVTRRTRVGASLVRAYDDVGLALEARGVEVTS